MTKPITDTLRVLQGGTFLDKCTDTLAEAVRATNDTGKATSVTITLKLKRAAGAIDIAATVTNKLPDEVPTSDLLWPLTDGGLSINHPKQGELPLRVVEQPAGNQPVREVEAPSATATFIDAATGEIRQVPGA